MRRPRPQPRRTSPPTPAHPSGISLGTRVPSHQPVAAPSHVNENDVVAILFDIRTTAGMAPLHLIPIRGSNSNGVAERSICEVKAVISCFTLSHPDIPWTDLAPAIHQHLRNTVNATSGYTPANWKNSAHQLTNHNTTMTSSSRRYCNSTNDAAKHWPARQPPTRPVSTTHQPQPKTGKFQTG